MCELADDYYYGHDRDINYELVAYWYLKAANLGFGEAQYRIANMYLWGDIIEDRIEATKWLCKAALQGYERQGKFYSENPIDDIKLCMEFTANEWREAHMHEGNPNVVTVPIYTLTPKDMYCIIFHMYTQKTTEILLAFL